MIAYSNGQLKGGGYATIVTTDDLSITMNTAASTTIVKALKSDICVEAYTWNSGEAIPAKPVTTTPSDYTKSEFVTTTVDETIYSNSDTYNSGIFVVYK